jgi:N4-gp56 family major capsid protein
MPMNWQFDADVGVYKNRELSNKLLERSLGKCKVLPFTSDHGIQFGKKRGEYINVMHVNELPELTSAQLEEDTRIPVDKITYGNRVFRVAEFGRGVEYTNLMEELGSFNPRAVLQKRLVNQMDRALDTAGAKAFLDPVTVPLVFVPTSLGGGTWFTNGTPNVVASAGLAFDHCTAITDYMADIIHVPPYEGEDYVGLSCNKNLRSLKQDRLWQMVHMYLQKGDFFFMGEQGKTERIRWVEINRSMAFSNTVGSSTALGEACVFGDEGVARLEIDTPELRADPNYQNDFGRTKAIAWYGILAFGAVWDVADDGKAKIIRLGSA